MRRVSEKAFIHERSDADDDVSIGPGTKVWHFSHVMSNCNIGRDCSLGQNVLTSTCFNRRPGENTEQCKRI